MKITVLRKMRYQNTFVYVMQFDTVFQYLFAWNGDIYQNNITMKPDLWRMFLWKIGKRKLPYTADELDEGEKVILSGALSTIDKIVSEGKGGRAEKRFKEREIKEIQESIMKRTGKPCLWQAIDSADGFYYQCLTHGQAVKMKDGEKPVHEILVPTPYI